MINNQSLNNNTNQVPMAAQPTQNFAFAPLALPLLPTPSFNAVPMYSAPLPIAMTLPQIISPQVSLTLAPADSVPMFFDGSSQTLTSIPANLVQINAQNQYEAPQGYSFVPLSSLSSLSLSTSMSQTSDPEPVAQEQPRSRAPSAEPAEAPAKRKKYPHRSKQIRILEVHASLTEEYTARGLYADEDEVLRGEDTVRVHVKTFHGLNKIKDVLDEVHKCPDCTVKRIATPFSMKNKFQKKGFIVYLKLNSPSEVPAVQAIFARYSEHFKKCDVALPKEKTLPQEKTLPPLKSQLSAAGFNEKENSWADADLFMVTPPALMRRTSHEMAA
jgi:hypothetical protein